MRLYLRWRGATPRKSRRKISANCTLHLSVIENHDKKATYDHDGNLENNVGTPATVREYYNMNTGHL